MALRSLCSASAIVILALAFASCSSRDEQPMKIFPEDREKAASTSGAATGGGSNALGDGSSAGVVGEGAGASVGGSGTGAAGEGASASSVPQVTSVRFVEVQGGLSVQVETKGGVPETNKVDVAWTKNGEAAGSGMSYSGPMKKGDRFAVAVTPVGADGTGRTANFTREIGNTPPKATPPANETFDGILYKGKVTATDADGDALSFTLRSGPKGMTVDQATGDVKWSVPAGFTGIENATVAVSDGKGGEAVVSFRATVKTTP